MSWSMRKVTDETQDAALKWLEEQERKARAADPPDLVATEEDLAAIAGRG